MKNILVVNLTNIGDTVITLPVINVLKGNYPEAEISMVIGPPAEQLFRDSPFFKEVFVYDKKAPLGEKFRFLKSLWRGRYDLVIDLKNTMIPFLSFAKKFNSPFDYQKRKKIIVLKERHLRALDFLKLDPDRQVFCPLSFDADKKSLISKIQKEGLESHHLQEAIIFAPGSNFKWKAWPVEKFEGLSQFIRDKNPDQVFLITGAEKEKDLAEELRERIGGNAVNLAGKLSLKEFACLVKWVKLIVCNDSAAMQIGNYLETNTVGIFGPTETEKFEESGHFRIAAHPRPEKRKDLTQLSSEWVYQRAKSLLPEL